MVELKSGLTLHLIIDDVPLGDFIISGSWGGDSNHSTDGKINASHYKYKAVGRHKFKYSC